MLLLLLLLCRVCVCVCVCAVLCKRVVLVWRERGWPSEEACKRHETDARAEVRR